jgi:hypothetical protein
MNGALDASVEWRFRGDDHVVHVAPA